MLAWRITSGWSRQRPSSVSSTVKGNKELTQWRWPRQRRYHKSAKTKTVISLTATMPWEQGLRHKKSWKQFSRRGISKKNVALSTGPTMDSNQFKHEMAKVASLSTPFGRNNYSDDQITLTTRLASQADFFIFLWGSYFASSLHADVVKYESTTATTTTWEAVLRRTNARIVSLFIRCGQITLSNLLIISSVAHRYTL